MHALAGVQTQLLKGMNEGESDSSRESEGRDPSKTKMNDSSGGTRR